MKYKYRSSRYSSYLVKKLEKKSRRRFLLTIIMVGILSYFLITWILPNLIGGLSLINKFKSNPQIQTTANEDLTIAPPILNIPYEATNTATIAIKGYAQSNIKVEIYLDNDLINTTETKEDGSFITEEIELSLGTNNIFGKTVDEKGNKSLPSKTIRVIYDNEKPKLELTSPPDNQEIKGGDKKVTISGSTNSNKNVFVTANGIRLIVSSDGNFSQNIDINEGDNNIVVIAGDEAGNTTQITRKVTYISS